MNAANFFWIIIIIIIFRHLFISKMAFLDASALFINHFNDSFGIPYLGEKRTGHCPKTIAACHSTFFFLFHLMEFFPVQ